MRSVGRWEFNEWYRVGGSIAWGEQQNGNDRFLNGMAIVRLFGQSVPETYVHGQMLCKRVSKCIAHW